MKSLLLNDNTARLLESYSRAKQLPEEVALEALLETAMQLTELERDVRANWAAQGDNDEDFEADLESIIRQDRAAQRRLAAAASFNAVPRAQ